MKIPKIIIGALWLLVSAFYLSANGDLFFAEKIREIGQVETLGQAVFAIFIGIQFWILAVTALFHNDRLRMNHP
jgi:hypothetical protein